LVAFGRLRAETEPALRMIPKRHSVGKSVSTQICLDVGAAAGAGAGCALANRRAGADSDGASEYALAA
jgi:hypothetical protein